MNYIDAYVLAVPTANREAYMIFGGFDTIVQA